MSTDIQVQISAAVEAIHNQNNVADYTPKILESLVWIKTNANRRGWASHLEFANLYGNIPMPSGLVILDFPERGTVLGSISLTGAANMLLEAYKKLEEK